MSEALQCVKKTAVITGWDFSTGGVKCLAFDIEGHVLAEVRLPTDIWFGDSPATGIRELNVMQLEGQAYASTRAIAAELTRLGRIKDWVAGGFRLPTIRQPASTAWAIKFAGQSAGTTPPLQNITRKGWLDSVARSASAS